MNDIRNNVRVGKRELFTDEEYKTIGYNVRMIRESLYLTRDQLAELAGMSTHCIVTCEKGTAKSRVSTIVAIAKALKTSVDTLKNDIVKEDADTKSAEIVKTVTQVTITDDKGDCYKAVVQPGGYAKYKIGNKEICIQVIQEDNLL